MREERTKDQSKRKWTPGGRPLARSSTGELLSDLYRQSKELIRKEILLARSELREDLRTEMRTAGGLGVAGICALIGATLLFVALALLIATWLPGWLSALIVAGFVFLVGALAGLIGWASRVKRPMHRTERTAQGIMEDVRWTRRARA